jgi:molybdate transport system substrate-binding protein
VVEQTIEDRITGISSMATRHVLSELAAAYERQSRQRVIVESVGGVDAARRVESGEPFDFLVLAAGAMDGLADTGHIDPDSRVDVARSGMAIAMRAGSRPIDLASEQAVRNAVLAARAVGYSTGPSGRHLLQLFQRWCISDSVAPRLVEARPGVPVGTLIARGDVDIGFQQLSELMHVPGIDIVGTLPPEIQLVTVFSGAVCVASTRPAAASALLAFLASREASAVKRRHGMEP